MVPGGNIYSTFLCRCGLQYCPPAVLPLLTTRAAPSHPPVRPRRGVEWSVFINIRVDHLLTLFSLTLATVMVSFICFHQNNQDPCHIKVSDIFFLYLSFSFLFVVVFSLSRVSYQHSSSNPIMLCCKSPLKLHFLLLFIHRVVLRMSFVHSHCFDYMSKSATFSLFSSLLFLPRYKSVPDYFLDSSLFCAGLIFNIYSTTFICTFALKDSNPPT